MFRLSTPIELSRTFQETRMAAQNLIVYAFGIFSCYLYYGFMHERIVKTDYKYDGDKHETFHYTLVLLLVQCSVNIAVSKVAMWFTTRSSSRPSTPDTTGRRYYAACGLTLLGAMLASHQALQHVAYPTQVLGKSIKPIPVMVMGALVAGKRYPVSKYLCVAIIVAGVATFMYKDKHSASLLKSEDLRDTVVGPGELLLMISLAMDGLAGAIQDKMRSMFRPEPLNMMLYINGFQVIYLTIGVLVSGEIFSFLPFVERHPYVLYNIIGLGLASAFGQMFISVTITTFGSLTCSIVTTTRKFFTILGSVAIMQNPMSTRQILGTSLVFVGLMLDTILKSGTRTQ